jgi:hypothetical protein
MEKVTPKYFCQICGKLCRAEHISYLRTYKNIHERRVTIESNCCRGEVKVV